MILSELQDSLAPVEWGTPSCEPAWRRSAARSETSSTKGTTSWGSSGGNVRCMCRNIRQLHNFEPAATDEEIRASALQYVRKVSGFTKPSQANEAAFARAVDEVAHITAHLLDDLVTNAPPKDREVEAAKARERAKKRYAAA